MAADDIRIRGFAHSWGDTKITIDGEQYAQISKISWEHSVEESLFYGQGTKPLGRTRGRYVPGAVSLTMSKASATKMKRNLRERAGVNSVTEAIFPIVCQYLDGDTAITVELRECRILKSSTSQEQGGGDAIVEEFEISTLEIIEDEEELISNIVL